MTRRNINNIHTSISTPHGHEVKHQMNISGTLNAFRLLFQPTLCLPHHRVSTFDQLPIPLSKALKSRSRNGDEKPADIRAVILDKDNCFAIPKQNNVYPSYERKFEELRAAYPGSRLLIVSNTAGTGSDPGGKDAELIERTTGVKVFRHSTKKPGCHGEVMAYLRNAPDSGVSHAGQVAVVGDRLFTDVMMANLMGAHGVWIEDGVVPDHGLVGFFSHSVHWVKVLTVKQLTRVEKGLSGFLLRRGYVPPDPRSEFE